MLTRLGVALVVIGVLLIVLDLFTASYLVGPGIGLIVLGVVVMILAYVFGEPRPTRPRA
jgi:drug/metabolite transporter (DMT)-like permease